MSLSWSQGLSPPQTPVCLLSHDRRQRQHVPERLWLSVPKGTNKHGSSLNLTVGRPEYTCHDHTCISIIAEIFCCCCCCCCCCWWWFVGFCKHLVVKVHLDIESGAFEKACLAAKVWDVGGVLAWVPFLTPLKPPRVPVATSARHIASSPGWTQGVAGSGWGPCSCCLQNYNQHSSAFSRKELFLLRRKQIYIIYR